MAQEDRRDWIEAALTDYAIANYQLDPEQARLRAQGLIDDLERREAMTMQKVSTHWGVFAFRGVLALLAAYTFFIAPGLALATLTLLIAAWILVDGVFALVSSVSTRSWALALGGAVGMVVGWLMLARPEAAAVALFLLTAAWAMARGVAELAFAVSLPRGATGRATLALLGVVSCLFGIVLIAAPLFGALALAAWIGVYALLFGALELAVAFQLRKLRKLFGPSDDDRPQPSYRGPVERTA